MKINKNISKKLHFDGTTDKTYQIAESLFY